MGAAKPNIVFIGNITIYDDIEYNRFFIKDGEKEEELSRERFGDLEELLTDFLHKND
jgi:hypothetical protein